MLTGHLDYFLTYKFSQDHLESYFSCIRASLGGCSKPTTIQVYIIIFTPFKKLFIDKGYHNKTLTVYFLIQSKSYPFLTLIYTRPLL